LPSDAKTKRSKPKSRSWFLAKGGIRKFQTLWLFLSGAAKAHDVGILTFKPQAIKTYPRHVELPIQLEMAACFHALGQFINTLETTSAVIKLERLQMASKAMASNLLHVQMTAVVYYIAPAVKSTTNEHETAKHRKKF
jgi:Tfp pilus assembly protein PilO